MIRVEEHEDSALLLVDPRSHGFRDGLEHGSIRTESHHRKDTPGSRIDRPLRVEVDGDHLGVDPV